VKKVPKKVLIVGSGGREAAFAWKLNREGHDVYIAPRVVGIDYLGIGQNVEIDAGNTPELADYAEKEKIDLTIVGPEAPLCNGIADEFQRRGLSIFGPTSRYARLEGDKIFMSELLQAKRIPTPYGKGFTTHTAVLEYIRQYYHMTGPVIAKARGLHGGKGVLITETRESTIKAVNKIFSQFGFKDDVLLQRYLKGEGFREASSTTLVGGGFVTLASSKDYKPVGENKFNIDPTLNTGGMGSLSPNPWIDQELEEFIDDKIVGPTIKAVDGDVDEGDYAGVLYGGLMLTPGETNPVQVMEINVRAGDPEIQPILMRMKSPLLPYLEAAADRRLDDCLKENPIEWDSRKAAGVVLATPGYPTGEYKKHTGHEFHGILSLKDREDAVLFPAGLGVDDAKFVNAGGRIAWVGCLGDTWEEAVGKAYDAIGEGESIGMGREHTQFRADIGQDALEK